MNNTIKFSETQLTQLRNEYSKIQTMNPTSPAMDKLNNWIGSLNNETLELLRTADIKWISSKATTEQTFRKHGLSFKEN